MWLQPLCLGPVCNTLQPRQLLSGVRVLSTCDLTWCTATVMPDCQHPALQRPRHVAAGQATFIHSPHEVTFLVSCSH